MKETIEKTKVKAGFVDGLGRRKTAVARVFLYQEKGEFEINGKKAKDYFPTEKEQLRWSKPFHTVGISHPESKFSASILVEGSGKSAQLDAIMLGIARALSKIDPEWSIILKKQSLLTRDSRMVERKKPNLHKARKATQYSKR